MAIKQITLRDYALYKFPTRKLRITSQELLDSKDLWNDIFKITAVVPITSSHKRSYFKCHNLKTGHYVTCNTLLQAHKICLVATYKMWYLENNSVKIPYINRAADQKSNRLLGYL